MLKSSETPFRAQRDGACQRPSNNVGYTVVLPLQPSGQLPRWGAKNVLPLNLIALPKEGAVPHKDVCSTGLTFLQCFGDFYISSFIV